MTLLMAMVLSMGSLAACGGSKDESTTGGDSTTTTDAAATDAVASQETKNVKLTVWAPQEESKDYSKIDAKYGKNLLEYMCEQFDEAHPEWEIDFEYKVCSEADAYTELSKDASIGGDVFMYAGDQTASLVQEGIVLPLTGMDEVAANNGEKAIAAASVKGMNYGVPFTPNTWFLYYDKSKYSEEDIKSLDTMMAKDLEGCEYNFAMDLDNGWYNAGFFYANGCTVFGADGTKEDECNFNDANGLAAAEAMLNLATNKKFLVDDDNKVALSNMKKGNCAALCSGTWDAGAVKEALGDNYAAAKLPTVKMGGKDVQLNSIGDYKYIGVNKNTDYPEVAQALAIWLGSEQCQLDRFLTRGVSPTWATLASNEQVAADVATTALAEQNQFTAVTPVSKKFTTNFWSAMEALGVGMANKTVTKDNLQAELDKLSENITTEVAGK